VALPNHQRICEMAVHSGREQRSRITLKPVLLPRDAAAGRRGWDFQADASALEFPVYTSVGWDDGADDLTGEAMPPSLVGASPYARFAYGRPRVEAALGAYPLSGTGWYGGREDRDIPDTPMDEWETGVEAFLAEWRNRHE
jgi:hypothetical protein